MNRYSDYLRHGDLLRIGHEGDPCSIYRSSDDAPSARVENIEREVDGTIRFRAVMDGSGATVNLDNRNVSPDRIWEIHPSQIEEFRKRVESDRMHRGTNGEESGDGKMEEMDSDWNGVGSEQDFEPQREEEGTVNVEEIFRDDIGIEKRVRDMEYRGTEIEKTIGGAIRELAGDMMRMYHGEVPSFSIKFADKYDLALHTDVSSHGLHEHDTDDRHNFSVNDYIDNEDAFRSAISQNSVNERHKFIENNRDNKRSSRPYHDDVTSLASYNTGDVRAVAAVDEP